MKRRQLICYGVGGAVGAIAANWVSASKSLAQNTSESITIEYFGHTCFLFTGNGLKVLVNPFRAAGCTAGYSLPQVEVDVVLISSFLLDEGAVEEVAGNPRIITQSGDYQVGNIKFQGISTPHDREGGRRFGKNTAWRWNQAGINILHLGGAAAPITIEEKILMGSPDVVLIPVGGGAKAYDPQQAKKAISALNPKVVIPTQYLTAAANKENCDLVGVEEFLNLTSEMEVKRLDSNSISIKPTDLPQEGTLVRVLNYT
ncbi:MBL fold metallo-hydrolase [Myxosarcina sp. GI1]|uniref:MBL fold metallo-hydrolase n=1 Tax=Myxosarcina sp. GI1 TaxID=1541065 RepID=UPI0005615D52|nr:MBL fold metallo-hydrolase [Myxosarcina sp. GI1]